MHVNVSHVESDNYTIETEYLLFKTKFLQGLHWQLTVRITYPSGHIISAENCYLLAGQAPLPILENGILCFIAQAKDKGNWSCKHLHYCS